MDKQAKDFEKGWEDYKAKRKKELEEICQDIADICPDMVDNCCGKTPCYLCIAKKLARENYHKEKVCKNIAEMHPTDGFTCSECGITIIDFREERVDEDDYTATWYEYEMKYCPNCGAKVVE